MVWAHRVAELELRGEGQRGGCVGSPVFLGGMCRWSQWREFVAITVHPSCHWREVKPTQGLIDGNRMSGGGPPPPPPGGGEQTSSRHQQNNLGVLVRQPMMLQIVLWASKISEGTLSLRTKVLPSTNVWL